MEKNISIITGGAGFIGSHLAESLMLKGHEVYILDDLSTGKIENVPNGAHFKLIDISDKDAVSGWQLPEKVDYVFHLAAQSSGEISFDNPHRDIDVNYRGTLNVLNLIKNMHVKQFYFSSSMSVYGDSLSERVSEEFNCNPLSYYGVNKLASEQVIRVFGNEHKVPWTILRLFNAYGPGQNMMNLRQGMVSIYMSFIAKSKPIIVKGSLERFRDFVFIDDIIKAFVLTLDKEEALNRTFNIATGRKLTVKELLQIILQVYGRDNMDGWVRKDLPTPGDMIGIIGNSRLISDECGWFAEIDILEGLEKMKSWLDTCQN